MKNKFLIFTIVIAIIFVASSCEKDVPEIPNPEEVITTLLFVLTPTSGGNAVTLTFQDLDGDGGNAPVITGGTLAANTQYSATLTLLNEQETPAENISDEVAAEEEEHQFFFQALNGLDLDVAYADTDDNGNPVGLATTVSTGAVSAGTLRITLIHEPVKDAMGVAAGDITNAQGETDIEVDFDLDIQ